MSGPSGFMSYGDLFSLGSFIIDPCLDLWGLMGKIWVILIRINPITSHVKTNEFMGTNGDLWVI